jgi:hypothetical protein
MKIRTLHKKSMVIPFEWIFAIIVGGAIILLAIYGVTRIISGSEKFQGKETAEKIKSYLDPFETGLSVGESAEINFRKESRIYFEECSYLENSPWGVQTIAYSEKIFGDRFSEKGEPGYIKNKYVFANEEVTGKDIYIFSKPFSLGYKVADLIMIDSLDYCFYQAPNEIKDELDLNIVKINFSENINECDGKIVCFDINNPKCDITVFGECFNDCESSYSYGKVIKKSASGKTIEMGYIDNLWIGAIFSSPYIYECNVKRLMNKFIELGNVYTRKINIIQLKGCDSEVESKLGASMNLAKQLDDSKSLGLLYETVNNVRIINEATTNECRLFNIV